MITPVQKTKLYDYNALYYDYPLEKLMENAGKGIAKTLEEKFGRNLKVAFICGPGNNGGDGLVAARYLQKEHKPVVFLVPEQAKSELTQKNWKKFTGEKYSDISPQNIDNDFDVIVECLFGAGITGKLRKPYNSWLKKINQLKSRKVSIDLPVPGFNPDLIISLMTPKDPRAITVDIGYPKWLKEKIGVGEIKILNRPSKGSHKGKNGQIFILAGNEKYHGALLLASKTAGKIADLVFISSTPENLQLIKELKSRLAEFIAIPGKEIPKYLKKADAVLVGPGLGVSEKTKKEVNDLIAKNKNKKIILDADALKIINKSLLNSQCLVTPHAGEFQKLFGVKPDRSNVKKMAQKYNCTILLKGEEDIVSSGEELKINETGNPGMTKGGTGDVLAGLITALASRNELFLSACAGAFINGLAGDRLQEKKSYYYSASELIEEIPGIMKWG